MTLVKINGSEGFIACLTEERNFLVYENVSVYFIVTKSH